MQPFTTPKKSLSWYRPATITLVLFCLVSGTSCAADTDKANPAIDAIKVIDAINARSVTPQQDGNSNMGEPPRPANALPLADIPFTFAVIADPQAFRLSSGGNPNSESINGTEWRKINSNLVAALNKYSGVEFAIMNGDVTEFGRSDSWNNVISVYGNLRFPYYFGLGNHDYQNNVGDCTHPDFRFDSNGCAMNSVSRMDYELGLYANRLSNFSKDWVRTSSAHWSGSMSYSWDYNGVHFVQLQNYPTYRVELTSWTARYIWIDRSLSWLHEDMRLARLRGMSAIIVNFHQDNDFFSRTATVAERLQFRAIMNTYTPLAIFVGHQHQFAREEHHDDPLFGNVNVYRTGAAFEAKAHIVTYDNKKLTISEMEEKGGVLEQLPDKRYEEYGQPQKPMCLTPGQAGGKDSIYITTFLTDSHWNLRQVSGTDNNVDADPQGNAYMRPWTIGNPYQLWTFVKAYPGWPEFSSWYVIKQTATGRVLDSDADGHVYTRDPTPGNGYQQWWPIKLENGMVQLRNRATNRFLDGDGSRLYTSFGYDMDNHHRSWQLSHGWYRYPPENSRYFKAKTDNAYAYPFPEGKNSNDNWQYLREHNFLDTLPCIAW